MIFNQNSRLVLVISAQIFIFVFRKLSKALTVNFKHKLIIVLEIFNYLVEGMGRSVIHGECVQAHPE